MIHRTLSIGYVVLLVCLSFAPAARAPPLAERVPDDAGCYMGGRGGESTGPAYEQSNLKALLHSTALRAIFSQTIPAALNKGMTMGDEDAGDAIQAFQTLGPP